MLLRSCLLLAATAALAHADHPSHSHGHQDTVSVPVSSSYSAVSSNSNSYAAPASSSSSSSYSVAPAPAPTYNAPAPSYSSSASAPVPSYSAAAPAPSYSAAAPAPSYSAAAPAPSYSAPAPAAPAPSYSAPASTEAPATAAPAVSTGNLYYYYYPVAAYPIHDHENPISPNYGKKPRRKTGLLGGSSSSSAYGGGGDSGLSPLLFLIVPLVLLLLAVPLLALLGVNLNNNTGRSFDGDLGATGRQANKDVVNGNSASDLDEKFGSFAELQAEVDLLLGKYITALDSDECMERIVCELGVKARAIPSKELFFSIVEWLAPDHTLLNKERIGILKTAATQNYRMETCQRYVCHPPTIVKEGVNPETLSSSSSSSNHKTNQETKKPQ